MPSARRSRSRARGIGRRRRLKRRRCSCRSLSSRSPSGQRRSFTPSSELETRQPRRRRKVRRIKRGKANSWEVDSRSPPARDGNAAASGVNGRRREPSEPLEEESKLRIWVAHSDCAKIIGKGGRTMRDAEARSRTKLTVQREDEMNQDTKERYVDIIGTKKDQSAAVELLLDLATYCREDEGKVLKDVRTTADDSNSKNEAPLVLEVHLEDIGTVLGRKGETVKQLELESGAKIELDKASGRVEIIGSKEAQEKARELLLSKVSFAKGEDGVVLKDQTQSARPGVAELPPPLTLWVKDSEAGRVIGTGGETVRDIRERTGAEVKVQKSADMEPGSTEREILILGEADRRDEALRLILAEVSWARGVDGPLKASGEEEGRRHDEKRRKKPQRERRVKERQRRRERSGGNEKPRRRERSGAQDPDDKSGLWVCATCGGDHRTKACPHETGVLGMGMQIGIQMGMQQAAMMAPPHGAAMMMMPGMHAMGMAPGGMLPGMLPMGLGGPLMGFGGPAGSRSSSGSSSGESGRSGDESSAQSGDPNRWGARSRSRSGAAADADASTAAAHAERSRSRRGRRGRRRKSSRAPKVSQDGAVQDHGTERPDTAGADSDENKDRERLAKLVEAADKLGEDEKNTAVELDDLDF